MPRQLFKAALAAVAGFALAAATAGQAAAETRVTYKSAKTGTSYYQMGVQIAEAMQAGTKGEIVVTVEESQGSVQNVLEVAARSGNYVFTTPPSLVKQAQEGAGDFADKPSPKYAEIRTLFPIPAITMHFVVRADSGIEDFAGLAGKTFLIGKGTFGATEAEKYLQLFGLEGQVELADVELNAAVPALKNGQIDGFATASSYPTPNVIEAAAGGDIRLLSMSEEQVTATGRTRIVVPAGTYPDIDYDVVTTSLAVFAFTTTEMDEEAAYLMTKTFWEQKAVMAGANRWWDGVTPEMLPNAGVKLHPGALRYYEEAGVAVPEQLR